MGKTGKLHLALFALVGFLAQANLLGAQSQAPKMSLLHAFDFVNLQQPPTRGDATHPSGRLIQAADGNFYGTTYGVANTLPPGFDGGIVYSITPAGVITILHQFLGESDGYEPSDLIQGGDGEFYGETFEGGDYGVGTIFKVNSTGRLMNLYSFPPTYNASGGINPEGQNPIGGLIQGTDGDLYGVTFDGGTGSYGTVFKISTSGDFTVLHDFAGLTDGALPETHVVEASDGNFYGTTHLGACSDQNCENQYGGIFKFTPGGTLTFPYKVGNSSSTTLQWGPLVEGPGGVLYGDDDTSRIFSLTLGGLFSLVFPFPASGIDGLTPGELVLGSDGNLYGTANAGGLYSGFNCGYGCGSVFMLNPVGEFTNLSEFTGYPTGGAAPDGPPTIAADGRIYGVTAVGGTTQDGLEDGVVYKLTFTESLSPPVVLTLTAASISLGQSSKLNWQVLNAYSKTGQQCYAFVQNSEAGAGSWTGKKSGTFSDNIYSGSSTITPTVAGTYTYALTCGGIESGFATLTVSNTKTTLSAQPGSVSSGQPVTLKAVVSDIGVTGTATGTISFSTSSLRLAKVKLNSSGAASFTASTAGVAPGIYPVTASYSGDSTHTASNSATITVQVSAPAHTTSPEAQTAETKR